MGNEDAYLGDFDGLWTVLNPVGRQNKHKKSPFFDLQNATVQGFRQEYEGISDIDGTEASRWCPDAELACTANLQCEFNLVLR